MHTKFPQASYERHEKHYRKVTSSDDLDPIALSNIDEMTVDRWRHERMYNCIDPILENDADSYWLTVGDGKYGRDSNYINSKGCRALPTDISTYLLEKAKCAGYVQDFSQENAEKLTFPDDTFDYTLCKESYHHFPRPILALYEMLRVSAKGVVLIEPNDKLINSNPFTCLARYGIGTLEKMLNTNTERDDYEETGNYIYRLSMREIEKVCISVNYHMVAFKKINDHYVKGADEELLINKGPILKKIERRITFLDTLSFLRIINPRNLVAVIFKETPSLSIVRSLEKNNYQIVALPQNPYFTI